MKSNLYLLTIFYCGVVALAKPQQHEAVVCTGDTHSATSTAYYPADNPLEGGYYDCMGNPLQTLQDYVNGDVDYVSVAMDMDLEITYGTKICIPEINDYYGMNIEFRVVDTGSAFTGKGFTRLDICVADETHSYDDIVNGPATLIFPSFSSGSPCCGCG